MNHLRPLIRVAAHRAPHVVQSGTRTRWLWACIAVVALATAMQTRADCPADLAPAPSGDGLVDVFDLLQLLGCWGEITDQPCASADLAPAAGDGEVNVFDLLALLGSWGECPKDPPTRPKPESCWESFEGAVYPPGQTNGSFFLLESGHWYARNRSQSAGVGVFAGDAFAAVDGDDYVAMDVNATTTQNVNGLIISVWLITPMLVINNGDTLTFWTRTTPGSTKPDRLEVRMSTQGTSVYTGSNSGSGSQQANGVGDFIYLLHSVNPLLEVGGYPDTWTEITVKIAGLEAPAVGRLAFRYYLPSAGVNAPNGNYIGIDCVRYTVSDDAQPPEPDCCVPHGGLGCNNSSCQTVVCAVDPICCSIAWDQACVNLALTHCGGLCQ
jgi:hypothetical protein